MATQALFYSSNHEGDQIESIYKSALWTRGFTFCFSTFQCHGDGVLTTQQRHRASLYNVKLLVSSVLGGFLYLPMTCFLWGSHGGVAPPLPWGQSPRSCWPLCLFAAALIHRCLLPAEQQVCDLLTRLFVGRVSLVTTVIGSSYPLSLTTFRSLIGQACQGGDRARDYGMRYGPGEKGSLSTATSQLKFSRK